MLIMMSSFVNIEAGKVPITLILMFICYIVNEIIDAVTKKDATKFLTLNDIVQPNTTITVYKYIENQLALQKQNEALLQVTKDLTTELRAGGNLQMSKTGDALDKLLNW